MTGEFKTLPDMEQRIRTLQSDIANLQEELEEIEACKSHLLENHLPHPVVWWGSLAVEGFSEVCALYQQLRDKTITGETFMGRLTRGEERQLFAFLTVKDPNPI